MLTGETDTSSAGAQLAKDDRSGVAMNFASGGRIVPPPHSRMWVEQNSELLLMPQKTPGSGAAPQIKKWQQLTAISCL